MNEVQRENIQFALVIVALVALAISLALATVAVVAIRELRRIEQVRAARKRKPSKALVPWDQRPQVIIFPGITGEIDQPVRRSALIGAGRRLSNDSWE